MAVISGSQIYKKGEQIRKTCWKQGPPSPGRPSVQSDLI